MLVKIKNILKDNIWLLLILILAAIVRVYGIYFDYPYGVNYIWDEIMSIVYLLDIFEKRNLFPGSYPYPSLIIFIYLPGVILKLFQVAVASSITTLGDLKQALVMNGMGQLYVVVRWYSVLFGTATIFLLYKIFSIFIKNKAAIYYGCLVYVVSIIPVYLSHWGKVHTAMVFFLILSLFFALKYEKERLEKYLLWSTIFAACAFSIHYIGISAAIFPFFLVITHWRDLKKSYIFQNIILYLAIIALFYFFNFDGVKIMLINTLGYYQNTNFTGMTKIGLGERFFYVVRDIFTLDPIFILIFGAMFLVNIKKMFKDPYLRYFTAGLFANYLLMVTVIVYPLMTRWLLIFFTLSVPMGAVLLLEKMFDKQWKKYIIAILGLTLIAPSIYITSQWLKLLNNNTNKETISWLENNLKPGEFVYSFDRYLDVPLSYEALIWHHDNNGYNSKKLNYIIANKDNLSNYGMNLLYDYGNDRYKDLGGEKTKYLIFSYYNKKGGYVTEEQVDKIKAEISRYHQFELVAKFSPTKENSNIPENAELDTLNNPISWKILLDLQKSGQYFEIYKLIK